MTDIIDLSARRKALEPEVIGRKTPKPGSDEAIAIGCKCPVIDNAHGAGYMGQPGIFVYVEGCPVHRFDFEDAGPNFAG